MAHFRTLRYATLPLALAVFISSAATASAAPITYSVSGTFNDGGTFSGTFTLDGANEEMVDSNIITSAGAGYGSTYTSSGVGSPFVQGNNPSSPNDFGLAFTGPSVFFFWLSGAPADFTGGPVEYVGASCGPGQCTPSREYNFSFSSFRELESGSVTATPEPSSLVLLATGLVSALSAAQKRKSQSKG